MDLYTIGFVLASLIYFLMAAVLGIWMGLADTGEGVRFAHVHFNLLGFMAVMIYGAGYFILPRFNARTLKWPRLVPVHFIIANVGLFGMVLTATAQPSAAFNIFFILAVLSIFLFAANPGVTLLEPRMKEEETTASEPVAEVAITAETRVGEIVARWPESIDILVHKGFNPLADPEHRER